jgi:hypothetical protein
MFASDLRSLAALTADDVCAACNGTGSITGVRIEIRGSQRIHPPRCLDCGGTGLVATPQAANTSASAIAKSPRRGLVEGFSEQSIPYGLIPDEREMEVTKR